MTQKVTIQQQIFKNPTNSGWIFLMYQNSNIAQIRFHYMHLNHGFNLTELYVKHKFRSKGFGKMILNFTIQFIQQNYKHKKIYLDIETKNKTALKLYTDSGFVIIKSYNTTTKRIFTMEYGSGLN